MVFFSILFFLVDLIQCIYFSTNLLQTAPKPQPLIAISTPSSPIHMMAMVNHTLFPRNTGKKDNKIKTTCNDNIIKTTKQTYRTLYITLATASLVHNVARARCCCCHQTHSECAWHEAILLFFMSQSVDGKTRRNSRAREILSKCIKVVVCGAVQ